MNTTFIRNTPFLIKSYLAVINPAKTVRPDQIYCLFHLIHIFRKHRLFKAADFLRDKINTRGRWWKDVSESALAGFLKTSTSSGKGVYPPFPPMSVKHEGFKMSFNRDGTSEIEGSLLEDMTKFGKETNIYLKLI